MADPRSPQGRREDRIAFWFCALGFVMSRVVQAVDPLPWYLEMPIVFAAGLGLAALTGWLIERKR